MTLSLVVAISQNNIIGRDGDLPWRLPDDLKRFKRLTTGHAIIMGRKTYDSIGRPLPKRRNIVLTRQPDWTADGIEVVHSVAEATALLAPDDTAFVIGGAEIYRLFLPVADQLDLTRVHATIDGDVAFPPIDPAAWELVSEEPHPADDKHNHPFTHQLWTRQSA